jgi:hypothetical protein
MPRNLTRDGKSLLTWSDTEPENHIDLLDLGTGTWHTILESASHHFYGPELSPQGGWISFVAKTGSEFRAYIAPVRTEGRVPESEWIPLTSSSKEFRMAFWSPDENLLYLLNEHGEGNLTWLDAQRLDAGTKHPTGEPFSVYHFKQSRVPSMDLIWNHPAAVEGRIVLVLADSSTNVWIMNAPGSPR